MIAYFDTSALVPLLVQEPGSARAASLWSTADRVVSVRLSYVEARAALARARRLDRLTPSQLRRVIGEFDELYDELEVVEINDALMRRASDLAQEHGLRGYDATHLAAAVTVEDQDLVVVAGDTALLDASAAQGLTTAHITASSR